MKLKDLLREILFNNEFDQMNIKLIQLSRQIHLFEKSQHNTEQMLTYIMGDYHNQIVYYASNKCDEKIYVVKRSFQYNSETFDLYLYCVNYSSCLNMLPVVHCSYYNHYSLDGNNPYIRIIIAGALVIAMRYIFGTTDYLGAGSDIIARSFVTSCAWYVFLLKMLFTAVTLGGGFKGGEIVPTLFVGATLGSFLAPIFGLPVGLCAACGMVSVFCGVTNCPLTSFILSIEMFGASTMKFTILCIALSYLLSGYYSLYNSQKIVYSKYKTEYINRRSH